MKVDKKVLPAGISTRRNRALAFWLCVVFLIVFVMAQGLACYGANASVTSRLHSSVIDCDSLAVVVHGFNRNGDSMSELCSAIREKRPSADVLVIDYPAGPFSNAVPTLTADRIGKQIDSHFDSERHKSILLIGHSAGALLLRKAFLYAHGCTEDLNGTPTSTLPARNWAGAVTRIVLLAGTNRGWSVDAVPDLITWYRAIWIRAATRFGKWTGTGAFIRGLQRGEPFVANLRIQWLELSKRLAAANDAVPEVIQFLGDKDDVVSLNDSLDLAVTAGFRRARLTNTGHTSIIDFHGIDGRIRANAFKAAISPIPSEINKYCDPPSAAPDVDESVTDVTFILHGIRDRGEWSPNLASLLERSFRAHYQDSSDRRSLKVWYESYGYFPMAPFLLLPDRHVNVRWFMDQYTEAKARFPNASQFNVVAHSNGTYVIGRALSDYVTLKVERILLAGSVLRTDFHWENVRTRVGRVLNVVAGSDWVVGVFPKVFETINFQDLGSAGFDGFDQQSEHVQQVRYVSGGHGAGIAPQYHDAIVDFLVKGNNSYNVPADLSRPAWAEWSSKLCWLIWLLILVALIAIGYWVVPWCAAKTGLQAHRGPLQFAYICFIVALLYTI